MLTNIPKPRLDQTLESYIALLQIENGISSWKSLIKYLFNGHRADPRSLVQGGLSNFISSEAGLAFTNINQLIQEHSLLAIYRPFLDPTIWDKLIGRLKSNSNQGMLKTLGIYNNSPFHTQDQFCPDCIKSEFKQYGFAYAHRCHQIKGNYICHKHKKPIGAFKEEESNFYYYRGLLIPHSDITSGATISAPKNIDLNNHAYLQYSYWVNEVFLGNIPYSDPHFRITIVQERIKNFSSNKIASGASALNKLLLNNYGASFLSEVGHPVSINHSQWPFVYLQGYAHHLQPVTNILILSQLFNNEKDYASSLKTINSEHLTLKARKLKVSTTIDWRYGLIKDLLCNKSLIEVSKKHSVCLEVLKVFLVHSPYFKARREKAKYNALKRKYRRIIEKHILENPKSTRSDLFYQTRTAYNWVIKNDFSWYDKAVPTSRPCSLFKQSTIPYQLDNASQTI
jgi:hypothetical protein